MTVLDVLRWLGETSVAVSALIVIILLVRKPFARSFGPRAAYLLWLAPAARPFLPELNVLPAPEAAVFEPVLGLHQGGFAVGAAAAPGFDWISLAGAAALVLWATVAFAWFSFRLEAQARSLRARIEGSVPASAQLETTARDIARTLGLRRAPRLRVSTDDDAGPCVIGLFRPVIFLPANFETGYAAAEQRLALAHEIAHVARGDMAAMLAACALQAAQWPNPLAHLSFRAFRTDQEAACDAYVLARCASGAAAAGDYAAAIVKSVRPGTKSPACGLSLAHPVKERLMLLKSPKKGRARLLAGAAAAAIFTATSLAATASYGFADEKPGKHETQTVEEKHRKVWVVAAEGGEALQIDGVKPARKIEIDEENGDRTVRIYGEDGELISENVYGPEDELPFGTVTVAGKDGKEKQIRIARALNGNGFAVGGDVGLPAHGTKRIMAFSMVSGEDGAPHEVHLTKCENAGEDGVMTYEFKTEEDGGEKTFVARDVVCLNASDADPEKRADALRRIIPIMEENAKKDAERRKEHIAQMKEELKKAEQEARKQ